MPSWPSTLPWINLGFTDAPQMATIRTPMSAGPAKQRPRFSAITRSIEATGIFKADEYAELKVFYYTTLENGSETFTQADPETGNGATWRFTGPPQATALRSDGTKVDLWRVSLPLEILP